jgi:hypothetical protein
VRPLKFPHHARSDFRTLCFILPLLVRLCLTSLSHLDPPLPQPTGWQSLVLHVFHFLSPSSTLLPLTSDPAFQSSHSLFT